MEQRKRRGKEGRKGGKEGGRDSGHFVTPLQEAVVAVVDAAVGEVGGLVERDLRGTWLVARVAESIFGQDLPGGEGEGGGGTGTPLHWARA